MENYYLALNIISCALLSGLSLFYFYPFLCRYTLDFPNQRSSHIKPVPSSGGISFVLIGTLGCLTLGELRPLALIPIAITGFIDDYIKLPAILRYMVQLITCIWIIIYSQNAILNSNSNFISFIILILFLLFCSTAIINFTNFMDGIDGLVAGCVAVILLTYSYLYSDSYLPFFGAIIGFLFWNWSPAKIFMGDLGSTFLGALLVEIIINTPDYKNLIAMILISIPLLLDPIFTLILRIKYKQPIFQAHRSHLYQRLCLSGLSHASVSLIYICATLVNSLVFINFGLSITFLTSLIIICTGFYLNKKVAKPFSI
ncbi:MraY family glycosyltransferase [Prochlorococcus marinus]|uniref:MraY family glycosyltransferase n=1 Tax=Prochlorococcus marinus TaxID=1219 RepID=UPI0039AF7E4C